MKKIVKKSCHVLLAAVLAVSITGCFAIKIRNNVRNPSKYFNHAYDRIDRIHRNNPLRKGNGDKVHVLVYDFSDLKLIQVSAPFWLVNKCMDIDDEKDHNGDLDLEDRYEFDWRGMYDLQKIGPGLLVEIEDDDTKVLIWIE